MNELGYRRLDVYQAALELNVLVERLANALPRGNHELADQARRAAMSVVLNLAEGAGEFSPGEKARFYRIARRSATECSAAMDIMRANELVAILPLDEADVLSDRVIAMITKLILRTDPKISR